MAKNDFHYGGWYSYTLQYGTIMTLISPGDCILQCGVWLWNRDSEFTMWQEPAKWHVALERHAIEFARWQNPAMWHVTLESWHWIRQVAAPCNVTGGSGMTCHWIRPNVRHIAILHLVLISTHHRSRHVIMHQSPKFLSKADHPRQKKMTSYVDFQDGGSQPSCIVGIQ